MINVILIASSNGVYCYIITSLAAVTVDEMVSGDFDTPYSVIRPYFPQRHD